MHHPFNYVMMPLLQFIGLILFLYSGFLLVCYWEKKSIQDLENRYPKAYRVHENKEETDKELEFLLSLDESEQAIS